MTINNHHFNEITPVELSFINTINILDLKLNHVNVNGSQIFAVINFFIQYLQMSTTAKFIDLSNNMIGPEGCAFICTMVNHNLYITDLVSLLATKTSSSWCFFNSHSSWMMEDFYSLVISSRLWNIIFGIMIDFLTRRLIIFWYCYWFLPHTWPVSCCTGNVSCVNPFETLENYVECSGLNK